MLSTTKKRVSFITKVNIFSCHDNFDRNNSQLPSHTVTAKLSFQLVQGYLPECEHRGSGRTVSVNDLFLICANNCLAPKTLNSKIGIKRRGIFYTCKLIKSIHYYHYCYLAEAGDCPNLENKEWNIGHCNHCYCRNGEVFCESTCDENP